jgi:hypothetical protein
LLPTIDQVTDATITVGLGVLLAVGFAASYTTLLDLAVAEGGYPAWLAPAVPLAFDLGIVVLSLKVVRAAREGRTAPVLRVLVVALSIATVAANASAATGPAGAVLHAIPPAMFVVCFESVIASTRRHALERFGLVPPKLPRVRGVRWILAPWTTYTTWRRAVLERDLFEQPHAAPKRTPQPIPERPAPAVEAPRPLRIVTPAKRKTAGTKRVDFATLLATAQPMALDRARNGEAPFTQRTLTAALKGAGLACGSQRALELLDALNADTRQEA